MVTRCLRITCTNPPLAIPVTITTAAGGISVAVANPARLSILIQNVGTEPALVRLGGDPSAIAYNVILAADTGSKKGSGGSILIGDFQGSIKAITEANTTVLAVLEELSTV